MCCGNNGWGGGNGCGCLWIILIIIILCCCCGGSWGGSGCGCNCGCNNNCGCNDGFCLAVYVPSGEERGLWAPLLCASARYRPCSVSTSSTPRSWGARGTWGSSSAVRHRAAVQPA